MEVVAPAGVLHGTRGRRVSARTITNRLLRVSGLKRCVGCKLVLPDDTFASNRANPDGRSKACRDCDGSRLAMRTDGNERHARWRRENRESYLAWGRRNAANRRARLRNAFVESVDAAVLLERDAGICGICGGDVDPEAFDVDHIRPLCQGGEHSYANTRVAHPHCNRSRGGILGAALTNNQEA